jgi:hypothetical protein
MWTLPLQLLPRWLRRAAVRSGLLPARLGGDALARVAEGYAAGPGMQVSWTLGRAVAGMGSWPSRLVAGGGHGGRTFVALAAVLSRAAARAVSDVVESADAGGELLWPATEPHATGGVLFYFF